MRNRADIPPGILTRGFTILELLVATTIVMIAMLILTQIFSQTNEGVSFFNRKLDAVTQFRTTMSRIAYDLGARVSVLDEKPVDVTKKPGNDELNFYSAVRTPQANGRLAKLGYKIGMSPSSTSSQVIPSIIRTNGNVDWDTSPKAAAAGAPETLTPGIFRLEISFLSKKGRITATPPTSDADLRAVIVSVATLDTETYLKLSDSQIGLLASCLADSTDNQTPMTKWKATDFSALPVSVQQNVRFTENYFYVR